MKYGSETKKRSVKKIVILVVISLAALVVIAALCESLGLFPGSLLNRFAVERYLHSQYQKDCQVTYREYDRITKTYGYDCRLDGVVFFMSASHLQVRDDGYFEEFLQNKELLRALEQNLSVLLEARLEAQEISLDLSSLKVEMRLPREAYPDSDQTTVDRLREHHLSEAKLTVSLLAEKTSFEEYKKKVAIALAQLQEICPTVPSFCQFFYYYDAGPGQELVLQYESQIPAFLFSSDENGVLHTSGMHFIVELSDEQARKVKLYGMFRIVYLVCIVGTIVGLSLLWIVRKRRRMRAKAGKNKSPD